MNRYTTLIICTLFLVFNTGFDQAPQWKKHSKSDGVTVYQWAVPGSAVIAFKAEMVMSSRADKIGSVLADIRRHPEWNPDVAEAKKIADISVSERLEYWRIATPFIIKDRDFVLRTKADFDAETKTLTLAFKSVKDYRVPKTDYVRGNMFESRYILKDLGNGKTHVTFVVHVDPMGSCPKWIVNLFQKAFPRKNLKALAKQARKKDILEDPRIKKVFAKGFDLNAMR